MAVEPKPRRHQLHDLLLTLCDRVYFVSPPTNTTLQYPCIVYTRDSASTEFADNHPWRHTKRYQVTVISKDPDSDIPDKIAALPMSSFSRFFTADNLNHDVYNLFF